MKSCLRVHCLRCNFPRLYTLSHRTEKGYDCHHTSGEKSTVSEARVSVISSLLVWLDGENSYQCYLGTWGLGEGIREDWVQQGKCQLYEYND